MADLVTSNSRLVDDELDIEMTSELYELASEDPVLKIMKLHGPWQNVAREIWDKFAGSVFSMGSQSAFDAGYPWREFVS